MLMVRSKWLKAKFSIKEEEVIQFGGTINDFFRALASFFISRRELSQVSLPHSLSLSLLLSTLSHSLVRSACLLPVAGFSHLNIAG